METDFPASQKQVNSKERSGREKKHFTKARLLAAKQPNTGPDQKVAFSRSNKNPAVDQFFLFFVEAVDIKQSRIAAGFTPFHHNVRVKFCTMRLLALTCVSHYLVIKTNPAPYI
ncbi:hypothetical protein AU512_00105 [Lonsdalea iberica]|uniref:Uncharacterized protein n=1 Tax=Lonsdalea iberica TaxID=1082703 RepID=A0ABX3XK42_9GAMM|nr:hypothetical protein [Lonsdalea iberica]OSN11818.1 hypothetical protein AU512_00105 [Lonsdalea iberica]